MNELKYRCDSCGRWFKAPKQGIQGEECPYCCSVRFQKRENEKKQLDPVFDDLFKSVFR